MLTDSSFENLSDPVSGIAESFTLRLLKRIADIARRIASDPGTIISAREIVEGVQEDHEEFVQQAQGWVDESLPVAYMRGIKQTDGQIARLDIDASPTSPITVQPLAGGQGGSISAKARRILFEFPRHHTMYAVFQDAAYNAYSRTRLPVVRDVEGKIRELIIESSEFQYRSADSFTRLQMSQDLVNRFADNNITGITYSNGRRVNLDSYAEMVARSQTGNAARQASMNRQQEYGFDLVRISTHYPTSDLCAPYQGHVYSISGNSDQYPPLESTNPGSELFHGNCYSKDTEVFTSDGWKKFYEIDNEKIYSLNPETREREFVLFINLIIKSEITSLLHFEGPSIDLLVTPMHNMYASYNRKHYTLMPARNIDLHSPTFHLSGFNANEVTVSKPPKERMYADSVYCLELERNHVMLVRRNGKTTWCGNCKHFQNPYFPGISPKQEIRQEELGAKENRKRYELTQKQRYHERQIKSWKRREATALTDAEANRARKKVRDWQARQRELVESNDHLRRKYFRESVTG